MTAPAQFTILREQILPSAPRVGESRQLLAITYQLAARPPQVVVIPADQLPDLAFLAAHPEETEVPPGLLEEGQEVRNRFIRAQIDRTPPTAA